MASTPERLILASASMARAAVLRAAGIAFSIDPADIDEAALKNAARCGGDSPEACAMGLAAAKALRISERASDALVIGADQLLVAGANWFDKPADLADAAHQLRRLRGGTHALVTACCIVGAGAVVWQTVSSPRLTMRPFTEEFLQDYLACEGEALLGSVGAYRLEGRGVQLFERIEGDHFAVLGLPLIELLSFLRQRGALPA